MPVVMPMYTLYAPYAQHVAYPYAIHRRHRSFFDGFDLWLTVLACLSFFSLIPFAIRVALVLCKIFFTITMYAFALECFVCGVSRVLGRVDCSFVKPASAPRNTSPSSSRPFATSTGVARPTEESVTSRVVAGTTCVAPVTNMHDRYTFKIAAPGLKADELEVSVQGNLLCVVSKDRVPRFDRILRLPSNVDAGKATAVFEDGLLTVSMPKRIPRRKFTVEAVIPLAPAGSKHFKPLPEEECQQVFVGPMTAKKSDGVAVTPRRLRRMEAQAATAAHDEQAWDEWDEEWDEVIEAACNK